MPRKLEKPRARIRSYSIGHPIGHPRRDVAAPTDEQLRELHQAAVRGEWGYGYGQSRRPTGRRNAFTRSLAVDIPGVIEDRANIATSIVVRAYHDWRRGGEAVDGQAPAVRSPTPVPAVVPDPHLESPLVPLVDGAELYRVVEVDLPDDDGIHAWTVATYRVFNVRRDGSFGLGRVLANGRAGYVVDGRVRHAPHTLGTTYHRTPEAALRGFTADRQHEIESARRAVADAERALCWAGARLDGDGDAPLERGTRVVSPPPGCRRGPT